MHFLFRRLQKIITICQETLSLHLLAFWCLLLVLYDMHWFYYKYWFAKFQKFSIKHTIWSQYQKIVLVDFITFMYFLFYVLVLSNIPYDLHFKALNIYKTGTYNREIRVERNIPLLCQLQSAGSRKLNLTVQLAYPKRHFVPAGKIKWLLCS